jgi:elongation factor P--(R)-beta-lysine ligase
VRRFTADNQTRIAQGKAQVSPDPKLIAALEHGIGDCAGIALGVDRLLMRLAGCDDIALAMPFADG